jgi:VWFA-related protein
VTTTPQRIALAALLLAVPPAAAPAGAQEDLSLFLDTVDVHLVNVEVMVTDADGAPVTGLGRDDFEVYEDGERVELTHFYAVEERRVLSETGAEPAGDEPAPAAAEPPVTRNLQLIVFVDELNVAAAGRNEAFSGLREALAGHLAPGDRVMLVVMDERVRVEEKFTADRAAIDAAIDRLSRRAGRGTGFDVEYRQLLTRMQAAPIESPTSGGLDNPLFDGTGLDAERFAGEIRNLAERRYRRVQATAEALGAFAASLAGLPGRKAILYLSDGLPVRAAESLSEAWLGKFEQWAVQFNQTQVMRDVIALGSTEFDGTRHLEAMVAAAGANRVAFYPLSVGARHGMSPISAEYAGDATLGGRGAISREVLTTESMTRETSLLRLAEGTGGVALTRSANAAELLGRMAEDFSTFYSLGYNPPHGGDREYHRIEVRVKDARKRGLTVRHLGGYREKDPLDRLQDLTLSALHYDVESNPLGVEVEPGTPEPAGGDRYRLRAMVKVPFDKILLLPEADAHTARLTLFVVVADERGGVSPFQRVELPIRVPNERILEAMAGAAAYPLELEMRGGRQRVALGVRDQLARIDATLHFEVEVGPARTAAAEAGTGR